MIRILIIISAFIYSLGLVAQEQKHVIFLKDKDNNPYSLSDPNAFLTQRALDRRTKSNIPLDIKDLPVTPSYVTQIAATGAVVVYSLKWFNAVVVNTNDPTVLAAIALLPFVDHIDQVLTKQPLETSGEPGIKSVDGIPPYSVAKRLPAATTKSSGAFNYGQGYNQAHMISVDGLHNLGYSGQGIMIAILDAGFYHVDQIHAFDSLWLNNQILGTRDFNIPGNNLFGDNMHSHGMSTLSTIGANLPGLMVGTAPHASFWLIRTEVADYEALIEEYNWAGGAEFADSLGADVISSSLGYTTFFYAGFNHTYADLDGNTTPVTRAADLAASRGIIVVNSAGNEGGSPWQYVGAPADGDSVLSIGAVDALGFYASFSSTGPTADGRIKPDVVAEGSGTAIIDQGGGVSSGYGTSFSCPIIAGAMACLLQSAPSFSAEQLRNAVRNTASRASTPDSLLGYGIPNMVNARLMLSGRTIISPEHEIFSLSPVPFSSDTWLKSPLNSSEIIHVEILSITGQVMHTFNLNMDVTSSIRLDVFNTLPAGLYFVNITTPSGRQVLRAVKL